MPVVYSKSQLGDGLRMWGVMTAMQQHNVPSYHIVQPEYPRAVSATVD